MVPLLPIHLSWIIVHIKSNFRDNFTCGFFLFSSFYFYLFIIIIIFVSQAKEQICKLIESGAESGARIVLDGRNIVVSLL